MTGDTPEAPQITPAGADLQRLYVNAVAVRGAAFDMTLDLGYAIPPASPEQVAEVDWLARVSMSWEHAASLMRALERSIRQYEEQAGSLPEVEKVQVQP